MTYGCLLDLWPWSNLGIAILAAYVSFNSNIFSFSLLNNLSWRYPSFLSLKLMNLWICFDLLSLLGLSYSFIFSKKSMDTSWELLRLCLRSFPATLLIFMLCLFLLVWMVEVLVSFGDSSRMGCLPIDLLMKIALLGVLQLCDRFFCCMVMTTSG